MTKKAFLIISLALISACGTNPKSKNQDPMFLKVTPEDGIGRVISEMDQEDQKTPAQKKQTCEAQALSGKSVSSCVHTVADMIKSNQILKAKNYLKGVCKSNTKAFCMINEESFGPLNGPPAARVDATSSSLTIRVEDGATYVIEIGVLEK